MPNLLKKEYSHSRYQKINEDSHLYCDNYEKKEKLIRKKRTKRNKKNRISLFSKCILLSIISTYGYFVGPIIYKDYFRPIILNRFLNRNIKIDVSDFIYPTRDYLHNSYLLDKYLLTGINKKNRQFTNMQMVGEMSETKNKLLELSAKYPKLQPSIYVFEYSTAKGIDINSDEAYPSASIIKIPIVIELMRLIDYSSKTAHSINLYDKRVFSEDFRTSGSGNLQKTKANVSYTIDYLANIMISESDNSATNMLLYEIGGVDGFNRFTRNTGLKVTSMKEWLPDIEGYNKTTAKEVSNILYNIDNPEFVSPKYKNIIKEYLGNTKNVHLLKEKLPADAMVLHKTGNIGTMLGDSGIVYTQNGKKYIVTIMVKRPHNDYSAKTFIQDASLIIYNDINSL